MMETMNLMEERATFTLRQAEAGTSVATIGRILRISEKTFYRRKGRAPRSKLRSYDSVAGGRSRTTGSSR